MTFLESDTPTVYNAGQQTTAMSDGAFGLAQRYLLSVNESRGEVHHRAVASALDRYRDRWHRPVCEVALEIESLGGNTCGSAVVVADGDQDAYTTLTQPAIAAGTGASQLSRPVNGPVAV